MLYIGIVIWVWAGFILEFYVVGGGVLLIVNGMVIVVDWMLVVFFIFMVGLIFFMGYDGGVFLMGWMGGYVFLVLILVFYLRKFGKFMVLDFIGDWYYFNVVCMVVVICVFIVFFIYVAG